MAVAKTPLWVLDLQIHTPPQKHVLETYVLQLSTLVCITKLTFPLTYYHEPTVSSAAQQQNKNKSPTNPPTTLLHFPSVAK